jgi:hypothetical protein
MVMALVAGAGGPPAIAQPPGQARTYAAWLTIDVSPAGEQILCEGERIEIRAKVVLNLLRDPAERHPFLTVTQPHEPMVENSNPASAQLSYATNQPSPFEGHYYELKGIEAGTGTLTFRATMPAVAGALLRPHAVRTVSYKVRRCAYEVGAVHTWRMQFSVLTATMDEVRVTADESGRLSGSATLEWIYDRQFPLCEVRDTVTPSNVDITGNVSDDGSVSLRFDYQAPSVTTTVSCPAVCPQLCSQAHEPTPGAVVGLSFPGGGGTVATAHPMGGYSGRAVFTVEPVEDTDSASTDPNATGAMGAAVLTTAAGS